MSDGKTPLVALRDHPRASDSIRRAKGWGGLAGFVVVAGAVYRNGGTLDEAGMRGLVGGVCGWMLAWIGAVAVWQQMLVGEARSALRKAYEQQQKRAG